MWQRKETVRGVHWGQIETIWNFANNFNALALTQFAEYATSGTAVIEKSRNIRQCDVKFLMTETRSEEKECVKGKLESDLDDIT